MMTYYPIRTFSFLLALLLSQAFMPSSLLASDCRTTAILQETNALEIEAGAIVKLQTQLLGDIQWSSNDEDVALVTSEGYVRALTTGSATITASNGQSNEYFSISVKGSQTARVSLPLVKSDMTFEEIEAYETQIAHRKFLSSEDMPGMKGYDLYAFGASADDCLVVKYMAKKDKSEVIPYVSMVFDKKSDYVNANMPMYLSENFVRASGVDFLDDPFDGYVKDSIGIVFFVVDMQGDGDPVVNMTFFPISTKTSTPYDLLLTTNAIDVVKFKLKSRSEQALINFGNGWEFFPSNDHSLIKGKVADGKVKILCRDAESLTADFIDITAIDLASTFRLKELSLAGNLIENIDVTNTPLLESLNCSGNLLQSISLYPLTLLTELNLSVNKLTHVDLTPLSKLRSLSLLGNRIESVDLSHQPLLEDLSLGMNQISRLRLNDKPHLCFVSLMKNAIKAEAMGQLIDDLPLRADKNGMLKIWLSKDDQTIEQNEISRESLALANQKGWSVYDGNTPLSPEQVATDTVATGFLLSRDHNVLSLHSDEDLIIYDFTGKILYKMKPGEHVVYVEGPIIIKAVSTGRLYKVD